eukprot:GGOE01047359.1.p2 GENE.GGOE01047359.1~~GGOE01047359.1.p2  ORF type:complete len:125 (-),score=3.41 GGOE01047359.1:177-551(-)
MPIGHPRVSNVARARGIHVSYPTGARRLLPPRRCLAARGTKDATTTQTVKECDRQEAHLSFIAAPPSVCKVSGHCCFHFVSTPKPKNAVLETHNTCEFVYTTSRYGPVECPSFHGCFCTLCQPH